MAEDKNAKRLGKPGRMSDVGITNCGNPYPVPFLRLPQRQASGGFIAAPLGCHCACRFSENEPAIDWYPIDAGRLK